MTVQRKKAFMAYLDEKTYAQLRKFARAKKLPMTQVVRESIESRIIPGDPYVSGFNSGVEKCIAHVNGMLSAQMRFPSGKSFAELVKEELESLTIAEEKHENVEG
jgi:hypothetical protein